MIPEREDVEVVADSVPVPIAREERSASDAPVTGTHTPGPWRAVFGPDMPQLMYRGLVCVLAQQGPDYNAAVVTDSDERATLRVPANARLIAAAPSMYSALHDAHSFFASRSDGSNEATAHFRNIGAVLAKAKGRS